MEAESIIKVIGRESLILRLMGFPDLHTLEYSPSRPSVNPGSGRTDRSTGFPIITCITTTLKPVPADYSIYALTDRLRGDLGEKSNSIQPYLRAG